MIPKSLLNVFVTNRQIGKILCQHHDGVYDGDHHRVQGGLVHVLDELGQNGVAFPPRLVRPVIIIVIITRGNILLY